MEQLIIIGTGCAGWTAAIYASRANLEPLVLAGTQIGGQLTTTTEVENFPGFPEGIMGPQLMMNMQEQAQRFGTRVEYDTVTRLEKSGDHFDVICGDKSYQAKAVIIATGASARYMGLPGEKELIGHGLTACATCDGAFYRNVPVCVVGGGDSACEEANFLTKFASEVFLIHRRDELRASKIMADRALANPKITPVWNSQIVEYLTDEKNEVRGVLLENTVTGERSELEVKCVFMAIGHTPNSGFLNGLADTDEEGYITQIPGSTATKTSGLFSAGDISDKKYRQAITAAGQGCAAALEAEHYLAARGE